MWQTPSMRVNFHGYISLCAITVSGAFRCRVETLILYTACRYTGVARGGLSVGRHARRGPTAKNGGASAPGLAPAQTVQRPSGAAVILRTDTRSAPVGKEGSMAA